MSSTQDLIETVETEAKLRTYNGTAGRRYYVTHEGNDLGWVLRRSTGRWAAYVCQDLTPSTRGVCSQCCTPSIQVEDSGRTRAEAVYEIIAQAIIRYGYAG